MSLSISNDYLTDFHVAREPKCALVVAGKIEAAFAVLVITRLHGRIFLSQRFQAEAFP